MNEEDNHILVGIVSKRLGRKCSQQDFAVFTSVSALLPWVEASIKENGGVASCGFNFSAVPTLGVLTIIMFVQTIQLLHPKSNEKYLILFAVMMSVSYRWLANFTDVALDVMILTTMMTMMTMTTTMTICRASV